METTIQVNFNRPLPVFPLPGVVLLPHAVQALHIFEKRYRQMVRDSLDGVGQIAIASFADDASGQDEFEAAHLRPAVCIGQVVQHHKFADGRYNVVVLGICRARIVDIDEPEGERLYRVASLRPLEGAADELDMPAVRERLKSLLSRPRLNRVRGVSKMIQLFDREDVPTQALIELVGSTLMEDPELRYMLLAEPNPAARANIIGDEIRSIDRLIQVADSQVRGEWPKGLSWN